VKNTRLCQLLLNLNKNELRSLSKLVNSPFFNSNKKCIELLEILMEFHKNKFEDEILTNEYLFTRLFPEKKKMTKTLNTTMSELVELINELKIQLNLGQKQIIRQHFLLQSLKRSGERKYFESVYPKAKRRLDNITNKNLDYYFDQYLLSKNYLSYIVGEQNYNPGPHLAEVINNLDIFYFGEKFRLTSGLYSLNHLKPQDYEPVLMDEIVNISTKKIFNNVGLVQLYRQAYLMISEPEEEYHFDDFMKMFWGEHTDSLDKRELEDMFRLVSNYCVPKIRIGHLGYIQKMYELYVFAFERKLLFVGKYIHQFQLSNMIVLACRLNKSENAFELVEKYHQYIHPKDRANVFLYNKAYIHFHKKEYGEAMIDLAQIVETDMLLVLKIKTLLLKCYYELSEGNAFYALCTSFRAYLRSKDKYPARLKGLENFTAISRKVYRVKEGFSNKSITTITDNIENTTPLADSKWLLEKVEELK